MKHEINIKPFKEEGILEVSKVDGFRVFKEGGKNYISFGIQDADGLKHVFNFSVESEPKVKPGTRIVIRFTKSIDQEWAEISDSEEESNVTPLKKEDKKPKPDKPSGQPVTKPPMKPPASGSDPAADDSFIEFDTPDEGAKEPGSADEIFQIPEK